MQTQIVLLENIRVFLKEGHSRCCIVGNVFLDELYEFIYDRQTGWSFEVLQENGLRFMLSWIFLVDK